MSRAKKHETEKIEKKQKKQRGKRWLVLPLMIVVLISGIILVDRSYRSMMMIQKPKVLGLERMDEDSYTLTVYGKNYHINKEELYKRYDHIKKEIVIFADKVKKQKEILLK